jgi:hypothetical protein
METSKQLPPPNWSPTGNSGCWRWDEIGEKVSERTNEMHPCWRWYDDEPQKETKKWAKKQNWFKRLFKLK